MSGHFVAAQQQQKAPLSFISLHKGLLQRKCACGGSPGVDGECSECREKRLSLQHAAANSAALSSTMPPIVHDVLHSPGQPLDASTRAFMEPRLGHDFSKVRVHSDTKAAESARAVSALAYTVGKDVVFGAGQYVPGTREGKRLMAHELTHVVQQQSLQNKGTIQRNLVIGRPDDIYEQRAELQAARVTEENNLGTTEAKMPGDITILQRLRNLADQEETLKTAGSSLKPAGPVLTPTSGAIRTVKVWLNAFIPGIVTGKTLPAPGPYAGKTMLNGPIFSQCYLTDNRTFDSFIHAPSRMHSEIEIDVSGPTEVFQWHYCYPTHEIDCTTGAAVCTRSGRTTDMSFSRLRGSSTSKIQVNLKGASNNPCYTGSPDIDYEGTITIDVGRRTVEFAGKIDEFPAFEMYATANGGTGVAMYNTMPRLGKDPWNLPGGAGRTQNGTATI